MNKKEISILILAIGLILISDVAKGCSTTISFVSWVGAFMMFGLLFGGVKE